MLRSLALFAFGSCLAPLGFSDVLVVDDDDGIGVDFTDVQEAVEAAADGDVLVLRDGRYSYSPSPTTSWSTLITGKSLTLVADEGAEVVFDQLLIYVNALEAHQAVTLRGITFERSSVYAEQNRGLLWIEDCTFPPFATPKPGPIRTLRFLDSDAVYLVHCEIEGLWTGGPFGTIPGTGVHAWNSHLVLSEARVSAGAAPFDRDGAHAVVLEGGSIFVSGGELLGGAGGEVLLDSCGNGGHGLALVDGTARTLDVALAGGAVALGCDGLATAGEGVSVERGTFEALPGVARPLAVGSPVNELGDVSLTLNAPAGDAAVLLIGRDPSALYVEALFGPLLVADVLSVVRLGVVPAGSTLEASYPTSLLPAGTDAAQLFVQALCLASDGTLHLGGASELTLLDEAF